MWNTGFLQYPYYTVGNLHCIRSSGKNLTRCPADTLAFLLIIYVALQSNMWQFGIPSLFKTLAEDATRYFLVIFTSHLVLELTLIFGTVRIIPCFPLLVH